MTVAAASGVTARRCRSTTSSPMCAAGRRQLADAVRVELPQPAGAAAARPTAAPIVIAWSSCSTTAATAPESCSIQRTCSEEDVGYTGTDWAPTDHSAKSKSVHS